MAKLPEELKVFRKVLRKVYRITFGKKNRKKK